MDQALEMKMNTELEVTPSEQQEADILDDPRIDKELRRWQDAIRDKLIDLGASDWKIDGAGCDSGDPLDFTLAEVGQGAGHFIDEAEALRKVNVALYGAAKKAANELSVMLTLNPARDGGLYREALDALNAALAPVDGLDSNKANK